MIEYAKDIILNSNISLRRNIKGFDFPTTITYDDSIKIVEILKEIYPGEVILLSEIDENTKNRLINDRDHIAINVRNFDMNIKRAYRKCLEVEKELDEKIEFAFSHEYGYLTSDGRNAGSGVEARLKMFLFGLVDPEESYYGFKQGMFTHGIYAIKYMPKYYDKYADDLYLLKSYGNYREDMDQYIESMGENIDSLVRNERRFRRDYQILNKISDEDIAEEIDISLNNLNSGKLISLNTIARELYRLKKYNNLGFNTDLTNNELDYLIFNLTKDRYKGKKDPERLEFLNSYMEERQWKLTD